MPSAHAAPHPPLVEKTGQSAEVRPTVGEHLRQLLSLGAFFGIGLAVSPPCALLARWFGTHITAERGQRLIRNLFAYWLKASVRLGVFEIAFPEADRLRALRGAILAPNHPSLLDAVILLAAVPRTVCIMRAGLINSPFLGGAARLAGYVTNDRGPALIRQGLEKIAAGENLLIFPEGTRTRTEAVNAFKNGFALIAAKSGAPIQTIFIERESAYLSKGVSLFAAHRLPFRYRIHLGPVVKAGPGENAMHLAGRLETEFRSRLENTGTSIRLTGPLPR